MIRINLVISLIILILLFAALCPTAFGKVIYVDDDATGTNDGSSWENAYTFLQDALADANSAEKPVEIRVAQGIYKPDQSANQTPGDREATFQLVNGVILKSGYAGLSRPDSNERIIELYETILSGDLNGDDVEVVDPCDLTDEPTRADNCYHVVTSNGTDANTILDGFTITGGNANGTAPNNYGGGLYNHQSDLILVNCNFHHNTAISSGGAIYNSNGNPLLDNCMFKCNHASGGGAVAYREVDTRLVNCIFRNNSSLYWGGALDSYGQSLDLVDCIFIGNSSGQSGGSFNNSSASATVIGCSFIGNKSGDGGGAIVNQSCNAKLTNCLFIANYAKKKGGAIFSRVKTNLNLMNCTFHYNSSDGNGGFFYSSYSNATVRNCIIWDNSAPNGKEISLTSTDYPSNVSVAYSDIRNGEPAIHIEDGCTFVWSDGNINEDPLFANPGYWADMNDLNIVVKPDDPNAVWIDGDYHLKSQTGGWDPVSRSWITDNVTSPCINAGDPNSLVGDEPEPNGGRINMGAYGGTAEASKSPAGAEIIVYIQWLGHSSVKVWTDDCIVYVDPQGLNISPHDAAFVLVTHNHGDHYSPSDIARVSNAQTQFIAPPSVISQYGRGLSISPGQTMEFDFVNIKAVPSYNINKSNHPKSGNLVGYIIELGGKRVYVAGDTDLIEEMKSLGDIDVAFLPAGGTYTMNATEAAQATEYIKPDLAIPYHWGRNVGTIADAQRFAESAQCPAMVMAINETISSDNWPVYSPLVAHWALDEAEGGIAHDIGGDNHGTLSGGPEWQPAGGKIGGALLLDGIDDCISTNFVLDPAKGSFSVFAWIKGGAPGQVVVSQTDGTGSGEIWLYSDPLLGKLMTGLVAPPAGRFIPQPLVSGFVITDGQWHHIGFVWDGPYRALYVDGTEVVKDSAVQNPLKSADGGLFIGAGKNLNAETFFSGLIDDVCIYNVALTVDEIGALVH